MNQAGVWGRAFQTKGRPSSILLRREVVCCGNGKDISVAEAQSWGRWEE